MTDKHPDVLVTFRRLRSGQIHQCGFACGADNAALILKEAWNTASEIISVEPLAVRAAA